LGGLSYTEIARELGILNATVSFHARRLYKLHGVRNKAEMLRKLDGQAADVPTPSSVGDRSKCPAGRRRASVSGN
jgi:hypothetical protein